MQFAEHSRKNAKPHALVIPFKLFDLPPDQRGKGFYMPTFNPNGRPSTLLGIVMLALALARPDRRFFLVGR
jgi:hypothetical protein